MKKDTKLKFKYILTIAIISLIIILLGYTIVRAIEDGDSKLTEFGAQISEADVGPNIVQKTIIKPYAYKAANYKKIAQFPIDKVVFNSCADYFCAQHHTPYGSSKRPTTLGNSDADFHVTHIITGHKVAAGSYSSDPKGDIRTDVPVYLDANGNIQKNLEEYDGYREKDENPVNTVYTNWVYIPQEVQFDCESQSSYIGTRKGNGNISDGGMAFLLACFKQTDAERASTGYTGDPLQHAVWDWLGQGGGSTLKGAADAFDKYHKDSEEKPNVDTLPDDYVGATYSSGTYTVGPFKMSKYVRAEDYTFTADGYSVSSIKKEDYEKLPQSEKDKYVITDDDTYERYDTVAGGGEDSLQGKFTETQGKNGSDSDLRGTIIKAEAIVTNESGATKRVEFPVPEPSSTYSIDLSEAAIQGYDELLDVVFTYQRVHSSGSGTWYDGQQKAVTFNGYSSTSRSTCTYACSDHNPSYASHSSGRPTGGSQTCTYTWDCDDPGAPGVASHYCDGDHSNSCDCDLAEGESCTTDHGTYNCGKYCNCPGHSGTHTSIFKCTHGHEDCWYFTWNEPTDGGDYNQDGFAGGGLLSTEQVEYKVRVQIPLKTQMSIYKYITSVDHVGETGNIYSGNGRRDWSMDQKYNDPVKVERGDMVEYTIEIVNDSRFPTRVKVKDLLPEGCEPVYASLVDCSLEEMPDEIKLMKYITVNEYSTNTYIVKVRPTQPTGIYTNSIEFITTNAGPEHMQFVEWGDEATHGPHEYGDIVNTDGNDGTDNLKEKDSDTYIIKEYNVNIDKYIYDVNHDPENVGTSNLDTTIPASEDRSYPKGMREDVKKANPVYAEFGDTVTYKIDIYNTTAQYDGSINRDGAPYYDPDKVYVSIEDILPKKYQDIVVEVSNNTGTINISADKFTVTDLMVPPDDKTTVTVTLKVDEHTKGTIETNSAEFIGEIKNINYGPDHSESDEFCVIENNPITTETYDYYKINNYNTFIDKYLYAYDEKMQKENNGNSFTENGIITNDDGTLRTSRRNDSTTYSTVSDGKFDDKVREPNGKDAYKKEHPVSVEKTETLTYAIRISNEAQDHENGAVATGRKPATQVRTTKVTDKMQVGLTQKEVTAVMYNADGSVCTRYALDGSVPVTVSPATAITENGINYNQYEYTIGNETILNPGEYIIYYVEAEVTESNMYLYLLENKASLTILTNINNTDSTDREIRNPDYDEDIAKQHETSEYVRQKDLVISGKVWLDINRDGLINESQTSDQQKEYYNINDSAMKKDILVRLYLSDGKLLRTTKTDENGLFTFGRDENLSWYGTYNHDTGFSNSETYQRVDKADNKDANGNYTPSSKYLSYYVEYEYDGVLYKSTEIYAGMDNLVEDGSFNNNYLIDSNATEFIDVREKFNTRFEYITYNKAYNLELEDTIPFNQIVDASNLEAAYGTTDTTDVSALVFDKTGHTSQLMESDKRLITARSFIEAQQDPYSTDPNKKIGVNSTDPNSTNYLWLFPFDENVDNEIPETEYLKHINLGLELREDVDIALTKDVYKVKTTIDGEEMEYDYNQNDGLNGNMDTSKKYLNDYIISEPYGLDIYEADYKMRIEQYAAEAVREYKGEESELNAEVTYRITIDNKRVSDDDTVLSPDDPDSKNLDVRINEVLDLYDQNFIEYTKAMEDGTDKDYIEVRTKDETTGLYKVDADANPVNKQIKVAEAWFYKKIADLSVENWAMLSAEDATITNGNADSIPAEMRYITDKSIAAGDKPIYAQRDNGEYVRMPLKISCESTRYAKDPNGNFSTYTAKGPFSHKDNNFTADGYKTLYITGMGNEVIHEGEDLDIYVKYVVDKDALEVENSNDRYEESSTKTTSTNGIYGSVIIGEETSYTSTFTLARSIKLAEKIVSQFKNENGRGTENIAQVNAYSVWYTDGKPASLVDMDSNAGNIGIKNDSTGVSPKDPGYTESRTSADDIAYYEDTVYKTGIEIASEHTENDKQTVNDKYGKVIITVEGSRDPIREITGHVWDDSRTVPLGEEEGLDYLQYIGDGILDESKTKLPDAKMNDVVREFYQPKGETLTEEKDIDVRSAKTEFVEIVEIPQADGQHRYYEQILTDVTWNQVQNIRTDADGVYKLYGFIPGKYIVRFTYGDTFDSTNDADNHAEQRDMLIFNGQDYKSTQYKTNIADNETNVDKIIKALEEPNLSDARDDEIRRLEVNSYSEVMTNSIAEILKGIANESDTITPNSIPNTDPMLQELTDKTNMNAETVEFLVRAEKLTAEQTPDYLVRKIVIDNIVSDDEVKDIYYKELESIINSDIEARDFVLENIDFGVEYRPENEIKLTKEVEEIKITTEDKNQDGVGDDVLVDLFFYTTGDEAEDGAAVAHHIDEERSKGFELVQFISNTYNSKDLVSHLATEEIQGFIYIQVDDEILQGSTIEVTYKFEADNRGEVDRISKKLDLIRYKNNKSTQALLRDANYGTAIVEENNTNYTASRTARNIVYKDMYALDDNNVVYRNSTKTTTTNGNDGYFGKYVGYGYYTGKVNDDLDTIACIKFDKILDYVDTDLEFNQQTDITKLKNNYWSNVRSDELVDFIYSLMGFRSDYYPDEEENVNHGNPNKELVNISGIEYSSLVWSVDDRIVDEDQKEIGPDRNPINYNTVINEDISRFLIPRVTDDGATKDGETRADTGTTDEEKDLRDYYYKSKGIVNLPVYKVFSAETMSEDMVFENVAEVVQFTTLTGRRTNFATTVGNANVNPINNNPNDIPPQQDKSPASGSDEFKVAALEPDTAGTETITLTPPTGLMRNRRAIVNAVATAKVGTEIIVIASAVVVLAIVVTKVTIKKYKKRRIK